jgi:hypothetical protein
VPLKSECLVVHRLAAPEPEIPIRNHSHLNQTTEFMSEMKYLRDRFDTLPTGPVQGVSTGFLTSNDIREPSSQSSSSNIEEMEVIEQTELLILFPLLTIPVQPLETSTSADLQVSKMAYFLALVQKHVSSEVCPLPPESPSLSQPKFMLFGAPSAEARKSLVFQLRPLPLSHPSPSVVDFSKLLCNTVRDSTTGSIGHQRTSITTLNSCGLCAWTLETEGFCFWQRCPVYLSTLV